MRGKTQLIFTLTILFTLSLVAATNYTLPGQYTIKTGDTFDINGVSGTITINHFSNYPDSFAHVEINSDARLFHTYSYDESYIIYGSMNAPAGYRLEVKVNSINTTTNTANAELIAINYPFDSRYNFHDEDVNNDSKINGSNMFIKMLGLTSKPTGEVAYFSINYNNGSVIVPYATVSSNVPKYTFGNLSIRLIGLFGQNYSTNSPGVYRFQKARIKTNLPYPDSMYKQSNNSSINNTNNQTNNSNNNCNGCIKNGKCYPEGFRTNNEYCDPSTGNFTTQLTTNNACDNNFECASNLCVNSQCISGNAWQKFISWLSHFFG